VGERERERQTDRPYGAFPPAQPRLAKHQLYVPHSLILENYYQEACPIQLSQNAAPVIGQERNVLPLVCPDPYLMLKKRLEHITNTWQINAA